MAPVKVSALPTPRRSESGRMLPPCTIDCFPVPHPDWEMDVDEKALNDLLPDDLPVVAGVEGNQTMSLLSVDLQEFLPKEDLPDSQTRLRTATNIQKALREALVHPEVVKSLRPAPTMDWHPGLLTMDDLRGLSEKERTTLEKGKIQFFFSILQEHITGGPTGHDRKIQQYLLAGLVFGWYPIHFRQKKLADGTIKDLGKLAKRIKKYDGGSRTFQSTNCLVMCPFPDCLYMCSSQPHAVKHAMLEHYHTMMVCGSCLCHVAPALASTVKMGHMTMSFKEHVLACGGPAVQSVAGPSTRSKPSSVTASTNGDSADHDAGSKKDDAAPKKNDADSAGDKGGKASSVTRAAHKHRLAVAIGTGSDGSHDSGDSDADGDSAPSDKKRKLNVLISTRDNSKEDRSSKRHRTGRK